MSLLNPQMIMGQIDFADLPIDKSHPKYSAWVWGPEDGLGTLNYLTPQLVLMASKEVKNGQRLCLNWDLTKPSHPGFGRQKFEHKVLQKGDRVVFDDTVHYNTQHSSQWDGFRHFGYQQEKVFYNNTTVDDILCGSCKQGMQDGMAEWAKMGIAGRGVLLDIYGFTSARPNLRYDPWTTHAIPLSVILDCAKHQNVTFQKGDILLLRTGYHARYQEASEDEIIAKSEVNPPNYAGVAQDLDVAEWLYDNKFAAVAGDAPTFESWPVDRTRSGYAQHEILLGGWGMPIGEMFYLEELVKLCTNLDRWSFFLTSSPLNVPGGVATTPSAMALF